MHLGIKGVDHIQQAGHAQKRDLLPKVGQMVQSNLAHHAVQWRALMSVGEKSVL